MYRWCNPPVGLNHNHAPLGSQNGSRGVTAFAYNLVACDLSPAILRSCVATATISTAEWRRGATMVRPAASGVSALSGFVANGRRACITFPLPPLKFRTVGFPQYGFKPALLPRPSGPPYQGRPLIRGRSPADPASQRRPQCGGSRRGRSDPPVQRSLARQPVILSGRVFAYYDLIRGSGLLAPISFSLYDATLPIAGKPRASPIYSACPSVRAAFRTPAVGRCSTGCRKRRTGGRPGEDAGPCWSPSDPVRSCRFPCGVPLSLQSRPLGLFHGLRFSVRKSCAARQ